MAANNVSNIHVSPDALSTLLSLQQGNLLDLQQQNLLDVSRSKVQQTTQQELSLNMAQHQLQEGEMQSVVERSEEDIERVYFVIFTYFSQLFIWVIQTLLFTIFIVLLVFHYKLPSMLGYRSFYFFVIEFTEL